MTGVQTCALPILVGITCAKAMSVAWDVPLIAVNHIEGHIHAVASQNPVRYPALALVVSGGHTHLFQVDQGFRYKLLGRTRDDAAGEAFDKGAQMLGLEFPGGQAIDRLARQGDAKAIPFPRFHQRKTSLEFSFSGLKTAVMLEVRKAREDGSYEKRRADLAASFQRAAVDTLIGRTLQAAKKRALDRVVIAGGVGAKIGRAHV